MFKEMILEMLLVEFEVWLRAAAQLRQGSALNLNPEPCRVLLFFRNSRYCGRRDSKQISHLV